MKKTNIFHYVDLTDPLSFKIKFFKNMDNHTGGKWLIRGTKHLKDNQLQSPKQPPEKYHNFEYKLETKRSMVTS